MFRYRKKLNNNNNSDGAIAYPIYSLSVHIKAHFQLLRPKTLSLNRISMYWVPELINDVPPHHRTSSVAHKCVLMVMDFNTIFRIIVN